MSEQLTRHHSKYTASSEPSTISDQVRNFLSSSEGRQFLDENLMAPMEVAHELSITRKRVDQLVRQGHLEPVVTKHLNGANKFRLYLREDVERLNLLRQQYPPRRGPFPWTYPDTPTLDD